MSACFQLVPVSAAEWLDSIAGFEDATIYQTAPYATIRWGEPHIHRLVLKQGSEILGAAQIVLRTLPALPFGGIAYSPRGPLTLRHGQNFDPEIFSAMTHALRNEFSIRRKAVLRLSPPLLGEADKQQAQTILEKMGFVANPYISQSRTVLLDLTPSLDDLRAGLEKTWRSSLSKAERSGLEIRSGTSPDLLAIFTTLYEEMLARKKFTPGADYHELIKMQPLLGESEKMRIWVCLYEGRPINATILSPFGTPIYLFGASGDQPTGANGSYLLQWEMVKWLKEHGAKTYDLGGIDAEGNPSVTRFKFGLAGKNGREVTLLPAYEIGDNAANRLAIKGVEALRRLKKGAK